MSTIHLQPLPLTGPLYTLSLLSSTVVALIGLSFLARGTYTAHLIFGIPFPTHNILSLTNNNQNLHAAHAYVSIIGVRDVTLSFLAFCFTLLRDRRGIGVVLAGGLVATVGDALVMVGYSEDPVWFIGAHVLTGLPMVGLCAVLLAGAREGKLKR